jgi:hypothetical protein
MYNNALRSDERSPSDRFCRYSEADLQSEVSIMHVESRKNRALQRGSCRNIIFNNPILKKKNSRGRLYEKGDYV